MTVRSRRHFLRGGLVITGLSLCSGCGISPLPWQRASVGARIPRIGVLWAGGPLADSAESFADPFRRGLAELGYTEGASIAIEWRADEGREDLLAQHVTELLALSPDLL